MIRINENDFDWRTIREIYDRSGKTIKSIRDQITKTYNDGSNDITKHVLKEWFFDGDIVSNDKIYDYLLSRLPEYWIERYAKIACKQVWGDEKYFNALLRYETVAVEATKREKLNERLDLIRGIITEEHITAGMFEIRKENNESEYRQLTINDLLRSNVSGSFCEEPNRILTLRIRDDEKRIEGFLKECEAIFNYKRFCKTNTKKTQSKDSDNSSSSNRDKLLNALNVNVCPYCNRQYITAWGKEKNKRNTADIDHFYNKDRFPFLALSLYNFVPSCQICNSRFKGKRDFYANPHVNPHFRGFLQEGRFEVENIEALIDKDISPDLYIHYYSSNTEELINSEITFHLNDLYKNHCDYAKEIIMKAKMFSKTQMDEYYLKYEGFFSTRDELYRIVYGNYLDENNQSKRPLSKLTQDLLYQLGISSSGNCQNGQSS